MSIPIIQSLWIGGSLSIMEQLSIKSFLSNGHDFHLYIYNDVQGIPEGVTVKDANEILPSSMVFKTKHGSYAGFSNIFRYKLLFEKGGYWVDSDVICIQPFVDNAEYVFASERLEVPSSGHHVHTATCVIKAPPGSTIMEYCYIEAVRKSKDPGKLEWGDIGPKLLEKAINKFDMRSYMAGPQEFCPVNWWDWRQLIDASVDKSVLTGAKAVHLWNEMWRNSEIDKTSQLNENSIYEWLKAVYMQESILDDSSLLVSVCVMSYNLEKYIAEALDSILNQKVNFKYNIVVGDDYSTDSTREILQSYAAKYPDKIKLLLHKSNLGMLANFAQTLKGCCGKYIAILDGDDYWTDPLKLQKQVDFLESHKEYSMVFHNAELHEHTENGVEIKIFNPDEESREYTANEILEAWTVTTCSVLCVNREQYRYIEKNLWFPVQDLPFYLCCATVGKIYYLAETMCVYRKLPTGSQSSEEFRSAEIHLVFVEYLKAIYSDFSDLLSKKAVSRASASHYLYAAHKSKMRGSEKDYQRYLALGMAEDPQYVYEKEIHAIQESIQDIANKKLDDLQQQYNSGIVAANIKYDVLRTNHDLLMGQISDITKNRTWKNPIKKIQSYKAMIKTYYQLLNTQNEKS